MKTFSHVTMIGRMTKTEPKYIDSPPGAPKPWRLVFFSVSWGRMKQKGEEGEKPEFANSFIKVKLFGTPSWKSFETLCTQLQPGAFLYISGDLEQNEFINKEGVKQREFQIIANDVVCVQEANEQRPSVKHESAEEIVEHATEALKKFMNDEVPF